MKRARRERRAKGKETPSGLPSREEKRRRSGSKRDATDAGHEKRYAHTRVPFSIKAYPCPLRKRRGIR
jgi:hypothetical protein